MTDKVQKIREEVARIQLYTQSDVLKEVLDYIDKVQEEAKFKTGDHIKPIDSSLGAPRTILEVCDGWYVTNQGTLDFEFEDNWELVEEPVSEEWIEELRTKLDSMSKEDFKKVFYKYAVDFNEEPVSDDLGEYINELSKQFPEVSFAKLSRIAVRVAKWQKQHLWKPADGNDLPIIDREVIALLDNGKVVFAHRPPEYWDGKDIVTGKVTRNYPKTYDKGGWNIPNVKWWLDCSMPKEIEL